VVIFNARYRTSGNVLFDSKDWKREEPITWTCHLLCIIVQTVLLLLAPKRWRIDVLSWT